jgi:hypothetical protein
MTASSPPAELIKGYRAAFINPSSKLLGPKFKFARRGRSGAELSELLPHLAAVVDDIAIVKSMATDAFNHAPGQILMNTGSQQFGRPSFGAWVTYGLGSESRELPGFVVLNSGKKGPSGVIPISAAASSPPSTKGFRFGPAATLCCTCPARAGWTTRCSATPSRPSRA